jgi:hypothetical protein
MRVPAWRDDRVPADGRRPTWQTEHDRLSRSARKSAPDRRNESRKTNVAQRQRRNALPLRVNTATRIRISLASNLAHNLRHGEMKN